MGIDTQKLQTTKGPEKTQDNMASSTSGYRPSSNLNNPKTMSASQRQLLAGEEILAHRQALAASGGVEPNANKLTKWSQIQKQHIKEAQEYEEEENAHFEAVKQQYKRDIEYQVAPLEFVKSHRVQVLKTRPKSPQIYTDSTFAKIGQVDAERKKNAQKEKEELNKMMAEQVADDERRKKEARNLWKTEKQVDLDNGMFPTDRFDENGKLITSAIPEKYLKGQTFSNEEKTAPDRISAAKLHKMKEAQEQAELEQERKLNEVRYRRDQEVQKAKEEKVKRYQAASDAVRDDIKNVNKTLRPERYGSLNYQDDDEMTHGNFYQTVDRRVHK